jgi:hypothetical protein
MLTSLLPNKIVSRKELTVNNFVHTGHVNRKREKCTYLCKYY